MPFSTAIVACVAGYTWIAQPLYGRDVVAPFGVVVLALGVWHAARRGDWGWSSRALLSGFLAGMAFLALMSAALHLAARWLDLPPPASVDLNRALSRDAGWFLAWGGAQQWLLQTTFLREAEARFRSRWRAPLAAALLFGALHLPNPALTLLTTAAALGWCAIYQRWPNVVPLALAHAAGTIAFEALFDESITGRLRVGYSYLQL